MYDVPSTTPTLRACGQTNEPISLTTGVTSLDKALQSEAMTAVDHNWLDPLQTGIPAERQDVSDTARMMQVLLSR